MKRIALFFVSMCLCFLMAFTVFAAETEKRAGTLPPLSVQKRIDAGEYSRQDLARTIPGQWHQDANSGRWWYEHNDGSFTTDDWEQIGDKWYHFDSEGWMQTGWFEDVDGSWYYLNPGDGYMRVWWVEVNGKWYYMDEHGVMQYDWITLTASELGTDRSVNFHLDEGTGECDFASDVKGCKHLEYNWGDIQFTPSHSELTYGYGGTKFAQPIASGLNMWSNAISDISIRKTSAVPDIFIEESDLGTDTIGRASFFTETTGWMDHTPSFSYQKGMISLNENMTTKDVTAPVVAHEMGHVFGLSHRFYQTGNIMFPYAGVDQQKISSNDIGSYNHLYN